MFDNPYHPPQGDPLSLVGPLGVVVRSRFPLDITAYRRVKIDIAEDLMEQRVLLAAQSCGYTIEDRNPQQWTLSRGSLWHALYTTSIRKLPTTVTVELISSSELQIHLLCRSALTISTSGDARRISRAVDELELQFVHGG